MRSYAAGEFRQASLPVDHSWPSSISCLKTLGPHARCGVESGPKRFWRVTWVNRTGWLASHFSQETSMAEVVGAGCRVVEVLDQVDERD